VEDGKPALTGTRSVAGTPTSQDPWARW